MAFCEEEHINKYRVQCNQTRSTAHMYVCICVWLYLLHPGSGAIRSLGVLLKVLRQPVSEIQGSVIHPILWKKVLHHGTPVCNVEIGRHGYGLAWRDPPTCRVKALIDDDVRSWETGVWRYLSFLRYSRHTCTWPPGMFHNKPHYHIIPTRVLCLARRRSSNIKKTTTQFCSYLTTRK